MRYARVPGILLLVVAGLTRADAANPNTLWQIVHDRCVPGQMTKADPAPCARVDLPGGTAVLKDIVGDTQYLLIPTARVTGIEDPAILAPASPNYFAAAWRARDLVDQRVGHVLPRDDVGLAINSVYGRTQTQLHIHIDCLRPDVIAVLREQGPSLGPNWVRFPVPLAGRSYLARRVMDATLAHTNPFALLASDVLGARTDMAKWTLVVAGITIDGRPGFILLADQADLLTGDRGSGEALQDHACAVKRPG
jgi:CDP-diacylglycerol pyrophosphatase